MSGESGDPEEIPEAGAERPGKRFVRGRPNEQPELSREELEQIEGEPLPYREAMSVLDANVTIPLNPSVAADVLSGDPDPGAGEGDGDDERRHGP